MTDNKELNMKEFMKAPFNLAKALLGDKVVTKNDQSVRVLRADRMSEDNRPVVALVSQLRGEELRSYTLNGECNSPSKQLFMLVECKEVKVDINDTESLERRIEQLKTKQRIHEDAIIQDLAKFACQQERYKAQVKVASFEAWQRLGTPVRRGEVAHDVAGVKVFHVTQTTQFGL